MTSPLLVLMLTCALTSCSQDAEYDSGEQFG